jgi:transcriptional regulator with XRE-family HTH domain
VISNVQIRAARMLLGWSQLVLADRAGVSPITVKRLEARHEPVEARESTIAKIRAALEAGGADFPEPDDTFTDGVRLRRDRP